MENKNTKDKLRLQLDNLLTNNLPDDITSNSNPDELLTNLRSG